MDWLRWSGYYDCIDVDLRAGCLCVLCVDIDILSMLDFARKHQRAIPRWAAEFFRSYLEPGDKLAEALKAAVDRPLSI